MSDKLIEVQETSKGYKLKIATQSKLLETQSEQDYLILETQSEQETKRLLHEMKEASTFIEKKLRAQKLKKIMGDFSD